MQFPRARVPIETRFWAKVNKDGPIPAHVPEIGPCWMWTAYTEPQWGYGIFRVANGDTMKKAHRVSWELTYGAIADGLLVLHKCDNPPCVRPAHLFLGTHEENQADKAAKGRGSCGPPHFGEASPNHKVTEAQVTEIRRRYATGGVSQSMLADEFGINQTSISKIVRGVRWRRSLTTD